jgi:hypothetical protein
MQQHMSLNCFCCIGSSQCRISCWQMPHLYDGGRLERGGTDSRS